ncbi:MAG: hypothetical protein ACI9BW_002302 [Gammaproteobacteria bacterium]|jgi:hypothetical protein
MDHSARLRVLSSAGGWSFQLRSSIVEAAQSDGRGKSLPEEISCSIFPLQENILRPVCPHPMACPSNDSSRA